MSNFAAENTVGRRMLRHAPIVLKPAAAGVAVALFWRWISYQSGWYFGKAGREPLMFIVVVLVGLMYVLFATIAVTSVFDQYKAISRAVVRRDVDAFLEFRDEQLPLMMHILVGAPSVILVLVSMVFDYENSGVGAAVVASVTYMLVLVWIIATELDDPRRSVWFRKRIPDEWYEIDIEEHFRARAGGTT